MKDNQKQNKNPDKRPLITPSSIAIIDNVVETSVFNLPIMPDLLTLDDILNYNLFSIYLEAMKCVACGMYTAGIILFGQLYEATLREIIFVKTNEPNSKATFGGLIKIATKKNILYRQDLFFLTRINSGLRNAYVHQKFELIFSRPIMPAFKIDVSGEDIVGKIKTGIEDVRKGKIKPIMVDLSKDPTFAAITKEPIDHFNALLFAWITNIMFEQLVNIYLSQKAYDEHISKFGNPLSLYPFNISQTRF